MGQVGDVDSQSVENRDLTLYYNINDMSLFVLKQACDKKSVLVIL